MSTEAMAWGSQTVLPDGTWGPVTSTPVDVEKAKLDLVNRLSLRQDEIERVGLKALLSTAWETLGAREFKQACGNTNAYCFALLTVHSEEAP